MILKWYLRGSVCMIKTGTPGYTHTDKLFAFSDCRPCGLMEIVLQSVVNVLLLSNQTGYSYAQDCLSIHTHTLVGHTLATNYRLSCKEVNLPPCQNRDQTKLPVTQPLQTPHRTTWDTRNKDDVQAHHAATSTSNMTGKTSCKWLLVLSGEWR